MVNADATTPVGYLGTDPYNPSADAWPYWEYSYSGNTIGRIVIGGYSEPTSVDRLQFTVVPLPAAVWFFLSGLFGLIGLATRRPGKS